MIQNYKVGVLGGGQLGKMLCLTAGNWDLEIHILDKDKTLSAASNYCHTFHTGDFNNYDDVVRFGSQMDIVTIEIEHVNIEALKKIESDGVIVIPQPTIVEIIKDKGLQKEFYKSKNLPTSAFQLFDNELSIKKAIEKGELNYPFVQKSREIGYDGKGVSIIRTKKDISKLIPAPSVVEDLVPIQKEISVIVARNTDGDIQSYPVVDMDFHPTANLVEYLSCPSQVPLSVQQKAKALAEKTIKSYGMYGLLAVEMFWTTSDELWINEVAPRTHNSGHHTIDFNNCSQFEQHLRAVLNLPLVKIDDPLGVAVMVNLLGSEDSNGDVYYQNFDKVLKMDGVYIHLYGKKKVRPYRKMGHATIIAKDRNTAYQLANEVKETLKIISK